MHLVVSILVLAILLAVCKVFEGVFSLDYQTGMKVLQNGKKENIKTFFDKLETMEYIHKWLFGIECATIAAIIVLSSIQIHLLRTGKSS